MKKIFFSTVAIILFSLLHPASPLTRLQPSTSGPSGKLAVTFLAGVRSVSDEIFTDVYGTYNLCLGLDVALRLNQRIEWFLHSDFLSVKGETSYSGDQTSLIVFPLETGLRFCFGRGRIQPYLGGGGGIYFFKEKSTFNSQTYTAKKNPFGYFAETGLKIVLTKRWHVDLKIKYSSFTVYPQEPDSDEDRAVYTGERDLRGFTLALGFGITI
jgi:opacity protein-like surface antigen